MLPTRQELAATIRFQRRKWRPKLLQWMQYCLDRGKSACEFMRHHNGWVRTQVCAHTRISKLDYINTLKSK